MDKQFPVNWDSMPVSCLSVPINGFHPTPPFLGGTRYISEDEVDCQQTLLFMQKNKEFSLTLKELTLFNFVFFSMVAECS